MDEIEAVFHPAFWVIGALLVVGALLYGFGHGVAESIWGPNPEKVRQECIQRAHGEKESCLNGGVGGSLFKTKGRIEKCDEIYQREVKGCG
jgi:hypothetical protein